MTTIRALSSSNPTWLKETASLDEVQGPKYPIKMDGGKASAGPYRDSNIETYGGGIGAAERPNREHAERFDR